MQIDRIVKDAIIKHKRKIELTQWAIIQGVSSLVYPAYIKQMTQKQVPVKMVLVPSIKGIIRFFDSGFLDILSVHLIDDIVNHPLFQKYSHAQEFAMFTPENIEIMKTIFDLYISPNVRRRIPETIDKKFGLSDETQQLFRENRDADIFVGNNITALSDEYKFVVEQIILQLLALIPTMKKNVDFPERNTEIFMTNEEVLLINNTNAICPIYFNQSVIENTSVIDTLNFVTSTTIAAVDKDENIAVKEDDIIRYMINTSAFNEVALITFNGIA